MYVFPLLLIAAVAPALTPRPGDEAHELAIKELADMAALSQVILNHCPDIFINATKLTEMRDLQHFDQLKDASLLKEEGRQAFAAFEQEAQAAPSTKAWCNENFELYGPAGSSIPGVLIRKHE